MASGHPDNVNVVTSLCVICTDIVQKMVWPILCAGRVRDVTNMNSMVSNNHFCKSVDLKKNLHSSVRGNQKAMIHQNYTS